MSIHGIVPYFNEFSRIHFRGAATEACQQAPFLDFQQKNDYMRCVLHAFWQGNTMSVISKDSLGWLMLLRQQVNEVFTVLSGMEGTAPLGDQDFTPLLDSFETAESFCVEMELPGLAPDDLHLSCYCSTLVIEGQKRKPATEGCQGYVCVERQFGRFCRTVELPPSCSTDGVTARYEQGVLLVTFPLRKGRQSIVRTIPIQQGD